MTFRRTSLNRSVWGRVWPWSLPARCTPWWAFFPPLLLLAVMFSTWDDAAISLFLAAIVPVHIVTAAVVLSWCPSERYAVAVAAARTSLVAPALLAVVA